MGYGLIGKTLGHSFSKIVHEALTDYSYQLYPLPTEEEFHNFMKQRQFPGINVTIPYKQMVIEYCESLDEKAKAIGAINTIVNKEGKLYGYNTDYDGFLYLAEKIGVSFQDKVVLILGTGGTFKTVSSVVKHQGAKEIIVASRNPDPSQMPEDITSVSYPEAEALKTVDIIVNTSPSGMYPNNHTQPISLEHFPQLLGVLDVVYNPLRSSLVQSAKALGIPATGGLPMLVAQAKFAAEHFQNKEISTSAMDKVVGEIAQKQSNLVLIGMPSCGKSTLGKRCAREMNRTFVDLDQKIEEKIGMSIPQLFETQGEEAFRKIETEVCQEYAKENGLVISTGGGIVTRGENIQALTQNGVLVYVHRPLSQLDVGANRPLSKSVDAIATLYQQRAPLYQSASNIQIENTADVSTVAKKIQEAYHEIFNTQWT